ncbi:MAG: MiaB/RimO family radical SAM methylthiotransferase [Candidatus Saganbacteria bacterium]|nr:MiaB/RimO family radical SAM methylthiotransferase [Candidatus Saganbacteria bacterium]
MNVADSARLAAVLDAAGYQPIRDDIRAFEPLFGHSGSKADIRQLAACDLILVNTCVVRQSAEDRAAWYVTSLKGIKELNPNLKIGLCGCLVPEPERDLKKQFPHVDFFIEPNRPEKLAEFLSNSKSESRSSKETGKNSKFEFTSDFGFRASNFVTIMHGCDNYCSYCVVPYVRGREYSRPRDEVLTEIKGLIEQGATDITLLGQNVNSYKFGFASLLRKIGAYCPLPLGEGGKPESQRVRAELVIRFMTGHPRDMSDEIIETVAALSYVAKDFHLPLQSGDNEVLQRMNRGYTFEYFLGRVEKIRSLMPQARISTDLMVGFPGETDEQFENSLRTFEKIGFTMANMFAYSPRPRTAAAKMPDQVPEEVKQARLKRLIEVNREILINRSVQPQVL